MIVLYACDDAHIERWTAKRRVALVVSLLKAETFVAEAARPHGLTIAKVEDWRKKFLLGAENALRSRAKEAARAVEAPVLRSDNGLIFQSRQFRQACRDCRLQQEFITPYRPEQNGIVERFFRSLKEE